MAEARTPSRWGVLESRILYAGEVWVNTTNYAVFGSGPIPGSAGFPYATPAPDKDQRDLRVDWQPSFEFPAGTRANYLSTASVSFGAIVGNDTLVSTGYGGGDLTFLGELYPRDTVRESRTTPTSQYFSERAHADQQYYSVYYDTITWPVEFFNDELAGRPHRPIGLEFHQTAMAWSSLTASRFVIIDVWIKNISPRVVEQGSVGLLVTGRPLHFDDPEFVLRQMVCGIVDTIPGAVPDITDTVNLAWVAHTSGRPVAGSFGQISVTGVMGVRVLRAPEGGQFAFNWWTAGGTWGPGQQSNYDRFHSRVARPVGDRGVYRMMTNGEKDYDQVYAAVDRTDQGWRAPYANESIRREIADGRYGARFMLSAGPFADIAPGDSVPFTFAFIAGEGFHTDPNNYRDNFDPYNPQPYLDKLNFTDLINNARWAGWTFDNPGVDTDGDGYRGEFQLVNCSGLGCDTVWSKGDGVPDFRPPSAALPAPILEVTTSPNRVVVRWNGLFTENVRNPLTGRIRFEGYKVYSSRFNISDQYSLIASWDQENYNRWAYQPGTNDWEQISYPLTIDEWKEELGKPLFDPRDYKRPSIPFAFRDSIPDTVRNAQGQIVTVQYKTRYSYWAPEGANHSNQYYMDERWQTNRIQRVADGDTVIGEDTLRFGVYEVIIENLNPSIPLYFGVTALDYGDYKRGIAATESSPSSNAEYAIPVHSANVVVDSDLKVAVYPNPYKSLIPDPLGGYTNYYEQGYEATGKPQLTERDRRIFFINLPETATIRIFTLDGDLVREIHHPDPFLTTYSSIVGWDLISRNTQLVESGIYLWRVDSKLGSQVGKLVIIR